MNTNKQNSHLDLSDTDVQRAFSLYADHDEVPYISAKRDLRAWLNQVKIGSESLVPKHNTVRLDDDLLPGHIILLCRINFGTFTTESVFPKYFEYDYGINAEDALTVVQEKGYARKLTAQESLPHLNAAQLKQLLKSKHVSGYSKLKKVELMTKVSHLYSEEELSPLVNVRGFELTEAGKELLHKYDAVVDKHPKKKY